MSIPGAHVVFVLDDFGVPRKVRLDDVELPHVVDFELKGEPGQLTRLVVTILVRSVESSQE